MSCLLLAITVGFVHSASSGAAPPPVEHGIGVLKGCESPTTIGSLDECSFTLFQEVPGDTATVTNLTEFVQAQGSTLPGVSSGNILPLLNLTLTGGATCNVTQTSCTIPAGGFITTSDFGDYTVTAADFTLPDHVLPDTVTVTFSEVCTGAGASNCPVGNATTSTQSSTTVQQFTSQTVTNVQQGGSTVTHVALGSSVTDAATETGTGAGTLTGTVSFTEFANGTCAGTGTSAGTSTLVSGSATSDPVGPLTAAGSYSFQATYSGDANYGSSTGDCETFTVGKATVTTVTTVRSGGGTITSVALGSSVTDQATVSGTGAGTPTGSVTFTFFANGACTGTGTAGTPVALVAGLANSSAQGPLNAGVYSFQATYSGDSNYLGSTGGCEPLTVSGSAPSTPMITNIPTLAVFGGGFLPTVTTNGDGVTSVTSTTSSVCTVAAGTVSYVGVGTCTLTAHVAAGSQYGAADGGPQGFSVTPASQTIQFTSSPPTSAVVGGPSYTVTAVASSGLAVILSIDSSASSVCTISGSLSGSMVSFIGVGTCTIDANQPGDSDYGSAQQIQQSPSAQPISFTSTPPPAPTAGSGGYNVSTSAGGASNVDTIVVAPGSESVCSVSGTVVTFIGVGTCTIDLDYNSAPQAQQSFLVGPASTSTRLALSQSSVSYGSENSEMFTATVSSAAGTPTGTVAIGSSAGTLCSISLIGGIGHCTLTATQLADGTYTNVVATFTANGIFAGSSSSPGQAFSVDQAPTFTSASSTSAAAGQPFSFTVTTIGSPTPVITIAASSSLPSGVTVIDNNDGTAALAGRAAVPPGTYTFVIQASNSVGSSAQLFTLTVSPSGGGGAPPAFVSGPSNSVPKGIAFSFIVKADGSPTPSISHSGRFPSWLTLTDNHNGTATLSSSDPRPGVRHITLVASNSDGSAQQSFTLTVTALKIQTITFTSTAPSGSQVDGPTYSVAATSSSRLAVAFKVDPAASSVCSVTGSTVTFIGTGTCVIDANQAGNAKYNPAPQVQQSFTVAPVTQAITSASNTRATVGSPFSFIVTTVGAPSPAIIEKGKMPKGVTFMADANGTALISGTPKAAGTFGLTITATFGTGETKTVVDQTFTLTVGSG
jgi:hypothetical protein